MKTAIWQGGQLHTDFEEPFENLKRSNQLSRTKHEENAIATDQNEIWLPFVNDYRTFLRNPSAEGRRILEQIDKLPMTA